MKKNLLLSVMSALLAASFLTPLFAQLNVTAVTPAPHRTDAPMSTNISVTFDQPVDPQSVSDANFKVFGKWTGPIDGNWSFTDNNTRIVFDPQTPFNAGETVTVTLAKTILAAGGDSMANGYAWQFWLKPAATALSLAEIERISVRQQGEGWIQTYGANAADLNGDGFTDFMVPNEIANDVRVFLNDGSGGFGSFTVHPLPNGARPSTNEAEDFNNDGYIDFVVGNTFNNRVHVLLGDGAGGFQSIYSMTADEAVRGICLPDLNGDGEADVVTANRDGNNLSMFIGDGTGNFGTATHFETGFGGETACAMADANNDGIMDVFVGAYFNSRIILLLGDGQGNLTYSADVPAGGASWMIVTGDVDRDGNVDVVSANSNSNNVSVIRGDGNGGLMERVTYPVGGSFPLAIDLGDLDGDGDLDMIASSFGSSGALRGRWTLYENDGSGNFVNPQYLPASRAASCAVFHDRDNDGDLDMTGIDELDDLLFLFENQGVTAIDPAEALVREMMLFQNYPNPFNPQTTISYRLSGHSHTTLRIYDMLGNLVKTLVNTPQPAGHHSVQWDGSDERGRQVSSGVYIYQLTDGSQSHSRKLLLLR